MNTISPLSGVAPVGSSTSKSGGNSQSGGPRQGQLLKATVIEAKGSNTFVLDFSGTKLTAQARMPLTIGQTLQLQVTSTTQPIQLQVVSDSANLFQGKPLTLLGDSININTLFKTLKSQVTPQFTQLSTFSKQTLESFFLFGQQNLTGKDSGGMLKQFIDRLGISFESLLARGDAKEAQSSLKAALLELKAVFKGASELSDSTNKLLNTLESYQLAQLQLDKDDLFLFPLPLPFLEKGYLIFEGNSAHKNEDDDEKSRFSLHLSLGGLGNIRIDIVKSEDGLYLRFISDNRDKLNFIEQFSSDLLPTIVGFPILGLNFIEDTVDPAAELLKRLVPDGKSLVNTKV